MISAIWSKKTLRNPNKKISNTISTFGILVDTDKRKVLIDEDEVLLTATEYHTAFGCVESLVTHRHVKQVGKLYVRPHHLELIPFQSQGCSANTVTILNSRFVGSHFVYKVMVDGQEIEVAAQLGHSFLANEQVTIKITPHTVNFFAD